MTAVVPMLKVAPGRWVDVKDCVPELSSAVGSVQDIIAVATPASVSEDWSTGQPTITGFSLSAQPTREV